MRSYLSSTSSFVFILCLSGSLPAADAIGDARLDIVFPTVVHREERRAPVLCFDDHRQVVVAFGGSQGKTELPPTLEWDGRGWTPRPTSSAPAGVQEPGIVFDSARRKVVLFGGFPALAATWTYDGHEWRRATTATQPPGRRNPALVYDAADERVLMFGGQSADGTWLRDAWAWDGSDWSALSLPADMPPLLDLQAVADPGSEALVLIGSYRDGLFLRRSTWVLEEGSWRQADPYPNVVPRRPMVVGDSSAAAVRMVANERITLNTTVFSSWLFDGTAWVAKGAENADLRKDLAAAGATWDAAREQLVMLGLADVSNRRCQTWLRDGDGWRAVHRDTAAAGEHQQWRERTQLWVDLNANGYKDLVAAYGRRDENFNGSNAVRGWGIGQWRRAGESLLAATVSDRFTVTTDTGALVSAMAAGDLDGDGLPEIAVGYRGARLQVINNRNGVLSERLWHGPNLPVGDLTFADLEGDGDLDLFVVRRGPTSLELNGATWPAARLLVFLNTGSGLQNSPTIDLAFVTEDTELPIDLRSLAVADFDGDGLADVALELTVAGLPQVRLLRNTGGAFQEETLIEGMRGPLALIDCRGDGRLAVVGSNGLLLPTADWLASESAWNPSPVPQASPPRVVDVDGDGDQDLAIGRLLFLAENGRLSDLPAYQGPEVVQDLADWNGDGMADWVCDGGVALIRPDAGSGSLKGAIDLVAPVPPAYFSAAQELSGTILESVLSWDPSPSSDVAFYRLYWRGGNGQDLDVVIQEVPASMNRIVLDRVMPGQNRYLLSAVDHNGNESQRVGSVMLWGVADTVAIGDGRPDFVFQAEAAWLVDQDGDGLDDLVCYRRHRLENDPTTGTASVALWRSMGDHFILASEQRFPRPDWRAIGIADIDGDGRSELLAQVVRRESDGGSVTVYTDLLLYGGTADGFTADPIWSASRAGNHHINATWEPSQPSAGLLVHQWGPEADAAWFPVVAGQLATAPSWTSDLHSPGTQVLVRQAGLGDWNGDAYPDLALVHSRNANGTGTKLLLFTGTASGFSPTPSQVLESNETSASSGIEWFDWDGDGRQDLTLHGGGTLVAKNNGGGSFNNFAFVAYYFPNAESRYGSLGWWDIDGNGVHELVGSGNVHEKGSGGPGPFAPSSATDTTWHIFWEDFCLPPWGLGNSSPMGFRSAGHCDGDGGLDFLLVDTRLGGCATIMLRPPGLFSQGQASDRPDGLEVTPAVIELVGVGARQAILVEEIWRPIGNRSVESFRIDVSHRAQFALADGDSQLVVALDGNEIVARADGFARVTVTYGSNFTRTITVLVRDATPLPVSLHFELQDLELARVGDFMPLGIFARLDNGTTILVSSAVSLSSADPNVATLHQGGVRARGIGSTTITANWRGLTANLPVQVTGTATATGLEVQPSELSLAIGERQGVQVALLFDDGSRLEVGAAASFASSDTAVASVDGRGMRGIEAGSALLQITYEDHQVSVPVTVVDTGNQAPVISSGPTATPASVGVNEPISLTVSASDPDDGPGPLSYAWRVLETGAEGVFSPDSGVDAATTILRIPRDGTFTVEVRVSDGAASITASTQVVVGTGVPAQRRLSLFLNPADPDVLVELEADGRQESLGAPAIFDGLLPHLDYRFLFLEANDG